MLITVPNSLTSNCDLEVLAQQIFECVITLIRWELKDCLSPCVKQTHHVFIKSLKLDETLKDHSQTLDLKGALHYHTDSFQHLPEYLPKKEMLPCA